MKIRLIFPLYLLIWCQLAGSESSLDIMTWNLQNFPKANSATIDSVISIIQFLSPDIIAIQEISNYDYFYELIEDLNSSDTQYDWVGYVADNSDDFIMELAYIINISTVEILYTPYIMPVNNDYENYFIGRPPYILIINFLNNEFLIINNHFKAFSDGFIDVGNNWNPEFMRQQASIYIENYIDNNFSNKKIIMLGDLNDSLTDPEGENVFWNFISKPDKYMFVDMIIAEGPKENFSWPGLNSDYPPAHFDHILITNELFTYDRQIQTIIYDYFNNGINPWDLNSYFNYISDHRPVLLSLCDSKYDECNVCGGDGTTCLSINNNLIPEEYNIHNIYPNPFNPVTHITYGLPENSNVQIIVYDLTGKQIKTLVDEFQTPGYYSVEWDASFSPNGVYFIKMVCGRISQAQKIILLK